jgi:hypothetical protein
MKSLKLITILMLGVALLISCDSRTQKDLEGIVINPTYTKNVNCHSQSGQGYFPDLDTYENVVASQNGVNSSKLLCSIESNTCTTPRMPKGDAPLSNGTITTIKNWIDNGYPEN